jgi:hypothetical protein
MFRLSDALQFASFAHDFFDRSNQSPSRNMDPTQFPPFQNFCAPKFSTRSITTDERKK